MGMKSDIKEKWVAALESGEYKQTTGRLTQKVDDEFSYCCLGVLSKVCDVPVVGASTNPRFDYSKMTDIPLDCWSGMPSGTFMHDIGIKWEVYQQLAQMNDNGSTFTEIATFIRKNL